MYYWRDGQHDRSLHPGGGLPSTYCTTERFYYDDDHSTDLTLHYLFGEIIVAVLIAIGISSLNIHAMQLQVKVISIE